MTCRPSSVLVSQQCFLHQTSFPGFSQFTSFPGLSQSASFPWFPQSTNFPWLLDKLQFHTHFNNKQFLPVFLGSPCIMWFSHPPPPLFFLACSGVFATFSNHLIASNFYKSCARQLSTLAFLSIFLYFKI